MHFGNCYIPSASGVRNPAGTVRGLLAAVFFLDTSEAKKGKLTFPVEGGGGGKKGKGRANGSLLFFLLEFFITCLGQPGWNPVLAWLSKIDSRAFKENSLICR